VEVDSQLRMRPGALQNAIILDTEKGLAPFLIVATAGTTNAGVIDPLPALADVAGRNKLWFHVDAAWGGGAAFVPELLTLLQGIELADSITFDAHKWLSVPMGAGLFLTRHTTILDRTFRVATAYMPKDAAGLDIVDPHLHSMQWSRRFIGLKVFLSLLAAGWDGYSEAIRHQTKMGVLLREGLRQAGWEIVNNTPLPVVCFAKTGANAEKHQQIASKMVRSGKAWISTTVVGGKRTVLRACITNYRTCENDVKALIEVLNGVEL
jgi:glutamate/tyrosine decarboxylase-like PLP-dependent enzyme